MTVDDRIRQAAREARAVTEGIGVPAAATLQRTARRRGAPRLALAAAVVVALVVAAGALLRGGGEVLTPADPAPVANEPAPTEPAPTEPASPEAAGPAAAIELPITAVDDAGVPAALATLAGADLDEIRPVGMVGETVLLAATQNGAPCVAVAGPSAGNPSAENPSGGALCGPASLRVEPSLTLDFDGDELVLAGEAMAVLAPEVARVVVTVGGATYVQEPRQGLAYLTYPVPIDAEVLVETFAADGRFLARASAGHQTILLQSLLRVELIAELQRLAETPGGAGEVDALERRIDAVADAFDQLAAPPADADRLLAEARAAVEAARAAARRAAEHEG